MSNHSERLFFALWPNSNVRLAINEQTQPIIQTINGKITPSENWHITLAFLGEIDKPAKACMQEVAAKVQGNRFTVSLEELGYWSKPRILWLGAKKIPDALADLVSHLTTDLQSCGYRPDTRPFRLHLTLMRKASQVKTLPLITPIKWAVEDFCLVRSVTQSGGASYEVIGRWLLN